MSAKFPRGGGGAGPFLARSLQSKTKDFMYKKNHIKLEVTINNQLTTMHARIQKVLSEGPTMTTLFFHYNNIL